MTLLFSNCTDCFMSQVWCPLASVLSLSSWSFSSWKCCEKAEVSVLLVQHHILRESGQGEPIQKLQCHLTTLPWYEMALYLSLLLTLHGPSMYSFRAERITQTPANSTFSHPITYSTFNAVHFDENLFTCQCKKEGKKAEGFQIWHFHCSFSSDIMAVTGLNCNNIPPCKWFQMVCLMVVTGS